MKPLGKIEAIVLDVDGTLYRQRPVRRQMALRLAAACMTQPFKMRRTVGIIRAFRSSLEELRDAAGTAGSQPEQQFYRTVQRTGLPHEEVRAAIDEWMFERPLALIGGYPRAGLHRFLRLALKRGIRLGAFSDYPCEKKLESLGVREPFAVALSSYDPEIGRFKPDPTGFTVAARRLATTAERTLMIGDRDDTDGAGARAAGMPFIEIGSTAFPSFLPLCKYLFDQEAAAE